jgi:hypothetical protein
MGDITVKVEQLSKVRDVLTQMLKDRGFHSRTAYGVYEGFHNTPKTRFMITKYILDNFGSIIDDVICDTRNNPEKMIEKGVICIDVHITEKAVLWLYLGDDLLSDFVMDFRISAKKKYDEKQET